MKPLLVTRRDYPVGDWADVAHSAGHGLQLWRERGHPVVFVDFGDLGRGISGVRLARVLRGLSANVRIFLLSDAADGAQRVWARANGADDVLQRDPMTMARALSPLRTAAPDKLALPAGAARGVMLGIPLA